MLREGPGLTGSRGLSLLIPPALLPPLTIIPLLPQVSGDHVVHFASPAPSTGLGMSYALQRFVNEWIVE